MIGSKFGKWTIIECLGWTNINGRLRIIYIYECDCGQVKKGRIDNLMTGTSIQCRKCYQNARVMGYENIINMKFGKWTVIERAYIEKFKRIKYICICECGSKSNVPLSALKSGSSLGCVTCDNHRTSHNKSYHELYSIWNSMKDRCLNSKHYAFKDYGGRGITVSEEWLNIDNFLKDMGERPKGLSLDRINNDMGYSKENCRWATWKEQSSNKRPRKTKSKLENYE